MKQESMKVLFFIRKSRLKKNGEAPIFLRVTIHGQQDEIRIQLYQSGYGTTPRDVAKEKTGLRLN